MVPVGTEIQDKGVWQHDEASDPQQNLAESPLKLLGHAISGMAALVLRTLSVMRVSIAVCSPDMVEILSILLSQYLLHGFPHALSVQPCWFMIYCNPGAMKSPLKRQISPLLQKWVLALRPVAPGK